MKKSAAQKHYLKDPRRVADLLNGNYFLGKTEISPEDVKIIDGSGMFPKGGKDTPASIDREHDNVFHIIRGINCIIVGVEHQNYIDPSMVLRSLEYVVTQYEGQRQFIKNEHLRAKDISGDEYVSRFSVRDLLKPVLVLVVYYGTEEWTGARTLHELLDWSEIPESWKCMFADYKMHLLEVHKIENLDVYHTDLRLLFGIIKYQEDMEKMKAFIEENEAAFREIPPDLGRVIREYTHSEELINIMEEDKEGGTSDMCKAFRDMIEEGRKSGIEEGRKSGIEEGRKSGIETFGMVVRFLLSENRTDDLKRASEDAEYREKMILEYEQRYSNT